MRILYVCQYFPPEMGAPSARVHELAREWVRSGHEVTVLTAFAHHPTGLKASGDRWKLTRRETLDGVDVLRTYVYATPNKGTFRRMLSYASFMLSAMSIGWLRVKRPDVVIASSPQLLCGAAGWFLSRVLRAPLIFEVRDLWPESLLAVEIMKDNFLIACLRRLARFLYQNCASIVTVGQGYKRNISSLYGIAPEKISIIPNGIDPALFDAKADGRQLRARKKWDDRFVVMYVGTHGMAHALENVLEAARLLSPDSRFLFVFVGEGAEKSSLEQRAAQWQLRNVEFIGQQPKQAIPEYYAACHVGIVSLRNTPLFQEVLPSKLFEYLAMERPVVLTLGGEAQSIIEESGAGVYVAPENPTSLAEALRTLAADPAKLQAMGVRGRQYVLRNFDRRVLAQDYLKLMATLCGAATTTLQPAADRA
ncbi:MAG TPA: glycosyltransferase family 4 protein [Planctomycetota bacterium]|nr:glycosyltransferase family 4 protein [Planctomycetota bacterium]